MAEEITRERRTAIFERTMPMRRFEDTVALLSKDHSPFSPPLEAEIAPTAAKIADAVRALVS